MHKCLLGISSISQCSSLSGTVWKSSSSSSAFKLTYTFRVHLEGGHWEASTWCCFDGVLSGDGVTSAGMTSSSSSEELKDKHLHTGLWCDSLLPELCGVTGSGSKDVFSTLEIWWFLEVLLSGVGMLKFLLPLS